MNVCYYSSEIKEELDGAKAYIEKAISQKKTNPNRGKVLAEMAEAEVGHAKNLMNFFEEDYEKETGSMISIPDIYPQVKDILCKIYTENLLQVKKLQDIYASK